jgi:hypothetical protein
MEPVGSLQYSPDHASDPQTEPDESSQNSTPYLSKIPFNIVNPITPRSSKFLGFPTKMLHAFFIYPMRDLTHQCLWVT